MCRSPQKSSNRNGAAYHDDKSHHALSKHIRFRDTRPMVALLCSFLKAYTTKYFEGVVMDDALKRSAPMKGKQFGPGRQSCL